LKLIVPYSNLLLTDSGILFPYELETNVNLLGLNKDGLAKPGKTGNILLDKIVSPCYSLLSFSGDIDLPLNMSLWTDTGLLSVNKIVSMSKKNSGMLEKYKLEILKDYSDCSNLVFGKNEILDTSRKLNVEIDENLAFLLGLLTDLVSISEDNLYLKTLAGNSAKMVSIFNKLLKKLIPQKRYNIQTLKGTTNDFLKISSNSLKNLVSPIRSKYGKYPIFLRNTDSDIFTMFCEGILSNNSLKDDSLFTVYVNSRINRKLLSLYFILNNITFRTTPKPRNLPREIEIIFGNKAKSTKRSNKELASVYPIHYTKSAIIEYEDETWSPICNSFLIQGE